MDDESTWPKALCDTLNELFPNMRAYEIERRRLDELAEEDIMLRIRQPPNPYQQTHDLALDACEKHMIGKRLIGFHCTRLHTDEISDVELNGLYPLSLERFTDRIRRREAARDIPSEIVHRLLTENQMNDRNRSGMLWFVYTAAPLKDESGVGRFFTFWGGEALYGLHERDDLTGSIIKMIGVPCIVEASMPITEIQPFTPIEKRLYAGFLNRRGVRACVGPDMEGYVRCHVPGDWIRRIIQAGSSDFLALTKCDSWSEYLLKT